MKLNSLLGKTPEELAEFHGRFYGVRCDEGFSTQVLSLPNGIEEISFLAELDEDPQVGLSMDFIDTVLAYVPIAKHVIIEVPFDMEFPAETAVAMANNFGTNLSVLPPIMSDDGAVPDALWDQYSARLEEYAKAWLSKPNCSIEVLPVVGYFQYLVQQAVSNFEPKEMSSNPYMQGVYVKRIPPAQSDQLKARLKDVIYEAFGGEKAFRQFAHTVCAGVRTRLVSDVEAAQQASPR